MRNNIHIAIFASILLVVTMSMGCAAEQKKMSESETKRKVPIVTEFNERVEKTDEEWKAQLTDMQYKVTRKAGTERAGTGPFLDNKKEGLYTCVGCGLTLFDAETKFESGSGWPSFYAPIKKEHIGENKDRKFGMVRVEVVCPRCDAHLGHVFDDGPAPTGQRYCINGAALDFVAAKEKMEKDLE